MPMRGDKRLERIDLADLGCQQVVGGELVDVTQCTLQCHMVLHNAQFRLAGEVANAVNEKLNVLLEGRTRRERRLVTALQAVQHQAATRCEDIAQQRHLRPAQPIEHHVNATVFGVLVDLHEQVLLFSDDHLLGTQTKQVVTLTRLLGGSDDPNAQRLAQLHEGRPGTVAGIGHQCRLPGLGPGQVDIGEIGNQQGRVMNTGLDRAEDIGVARQGVSRQHNDFTVHRVRIGAAGRKAGDLVTNGEVIDTLTHGHDHARHLMPDAGRQANLRRGEVLPPEHVVPTDADRLDANLHLAGSRGRRCLLFAFEHLGRTELVETDHAGHRKPRQVNR